MVKKEVKFIRYLNTGIFDATVLLSVGFKYDELIKHTKKGGWGKAIEHDKEFIDNGNYFALTRELKNRKTGKNVLYLYIIITEKFKFTDHEMCKLAHEVLHICQFFMKDMLDMEREYECVAYTHTHIMEQCLENMRAAYKK